MHAATVELLVQKARLEPDTALAIAEAIDMAINNAQLVTIPILDARFAASEAKMDARFVAVDARFGAVDVRFASVDAQFITLEAKILAALEKTKAELVRWVFVVMLGNVALSMAASAIMNAIQHVR